MKNLLLIPALLVLSGAAHAADSLPVREVTVFKDGHAFVLHEGAVIANATGEAVLGDLPRPVMGTFWAYGLRTPLRSVTAGMHEASGEQVALTLADLIKANIGAEIVVIDNPTKQIEAKILAVPQAKATPAPQTRVAGEERYDWQAAERTREEEVVWLQTKEGVLVRRLNSLGEVLFKTPPKATLSKPDFEGQLRLQWEKKLAPGQKSEVGMVYLQRGLRWIPSYRLALGKDGKASLKLQAALANELVDLKDVTANLVIGVPSFAFKDSVDPIGLQADFLKLSPLFNVGKRSSNAFSNAIMAQRVNASYALNTNDTGGQAAAPQGEANEDFFVFTAKNISLKKGERMNFSLADSTVPVKDIYTLTSPAAPPGDLYRYLSADVQRSLNTTEPTVMHKLRLSNTGSQPLTTAPTVVESNGRLLAQTLMTYTAPGGRSDIDLAPAVDVTVKRKESEVNRTPKNLTWQGSDYSRVDVAGRMLVTSYRNDPITLELSQQFVGTIGSVGFKGTFRKLGAGDDDRSENLAGLPQWWNSYAENWQGVNGLSRAEWTLTVPAKGKIEVPYSYSYFWRG